MANVYTQGQGVQRDDAESRRLLQRACELGDAAACLGSLAGAAAAGRRRSATRRPARAARAARAGARWADGERSHAAARIRSAAAGATGADRAAATGIR